MFGPPQLLRKLTWATVVVLLAAGYESDEEDALVLAAEAAAALVAEDGVGISVSGVVVDGASLEDVVARVGGGGEAATTRGGGMMPGRRRRGGGGRGRPDDYGRHPLGGPIDLRSASARKRKARSRDNESDAKREAVKIREHEESLNKQIFLMQKRQRL